MLLRNTILFALALTMVAFVPANKPRQQSNDGWVYEREKQGIKIFTRKGKWGKLRDSKATMTVSSTPEQMLKILTDFENYKTWMPRIKNSRMLARLSDTEFIMHMVISVPWPLKDRDCVMRVKISKDPKTGVITITETSEPKYIRADDDMVRIEQLVSIWTLIPTKNGGTQVTNEYASNPGGDVPDWLTNTQSVENPLITFENLQQKQKTVTKK